MKYFAFALCVIGGMTSAVYLAISGHPWLALLAFIIVGGMSCD